MRANSDKKCAICGGAIPAERNGHNTKYCSTKCARAAESKKRREYITKRSTSMNKVAISVYCTYQSKCALCGWQATPDNLFVNGKFHYSHGNEIHHIIPAREGGTEEADNLILLCPNHHKQADLGIISREELQKHTKPIEMTEEEKRQAVFRCADIVASAIFGD